MKIAYATIYDSSDAAAWSGSGLNIKKALLDAGNEVQSIGNLAPGPIARQLLHLRSKWHRVLHQSKYIADRDPTVLTSYSRQVELRARGCDIIFSPGTVPIAHIKTRKPIVFWTDATFAGMVNFYPAFTNLSETNLRNGNAMEQSALKKCSLAIYSSDWAAETAICNYDVDPRKVKVVPFGANIECNRTKQEIEEIVSSRNSDSCKLLFIGVDWERKGGCTAVHVAAALNKRGLKTELHVVGCEPQQPLPSFVVRHGFVSKKSAAGTRLIDNLLAESNFLIVPSRAECFGLVFAEASSFGLPSLSTKVGGIPTAVNDGINGKTFELDEAPEVYADWVLDQMSSAEKYRKLSLSSFAEYERRLNWDVAGTRATELILETISV